MSVGQLVFWLVWLEEKEVVIVILEGWLVELKVVKVIVVNLWVDLGMWMCGELCEFLLFVDLVICIYVVCIWIVDLLFGFKFGMIVCVVFDNVDDGILFVLFGVVIDCGNGLVVWVVGNGQVSLWLVKLVGYWEDGVLVVEGLKVGELVVIVGVSYLIVG